MHAWFCVAYFWSMSVVLTLTRSTDILRFVYFSLFALCKQAGWMHMHENRPICLTNTHMLPWCAMGNMLLVSSEHVNQASRFRICSLSGSHIPLRGLWIEYLIWIENRFNSQISTGLRSDVTQTRSADSALHSCVRLFVSSSMFDTKPSSLLYQWLSIGQKVLNATLSFNSDAFLFFPPFSPLICIQGKGVCILIFTSGT